MTDIPQKGLLTTNRKALTINLDAQKYGTFAEIGAGQETARFFFIAGAAAGTIAKTISAYDMTFSDAIYGKSERYVSEERLATMLDHEYELLEQRLNETIGSEKTFFAFANTVKARGYKGGNDANGWLGIRFQKTPLTPPSEIVLHVRMWDEENTEQQNALGVVGTNLIYGAFYLADDPSAFLESLRDNLNPHQIEIDFIRFSGPAFEAVDNRIMNLQLVRKGLTNAALFTPSGEVVQPSLALYKKAILVERGSFRPITKVNVDMLERAAAQFVQESNVQDKDVIVLLEITMSSLLASGKLDDQDFLDRVTTLNLTGNYVLISNYFEYFRLTSYFRRYTQEMIGLAMGANSLVEIFNEKYYADLPGGILENFGRLFRNSVKIYAYPMRRDVFRRYLSITNGNGDSEPKVKGESNAADRVLIDCENLQVEPRVRHLYKHLLENGYLQGIVGADHSLLALFSRDLLASIAEGGTDWEESTPQDVATAIKANRLFGYGSKPKA